MGDEEEGVACTMGLQWWASHQDSITGYCINRRAIRTILRLRNFHDMHMLTEESVLYTRHMVVTTLSAWSPAETASRHSFILYRTHKV